MTIPKPWRERPISPVCYFCSRPTAYASCCSFPSENREGWLTFCENHRPCGTVRAIAAIIKAGCRFEGNPEWVR